jgi:hypothetical protein
MSDGLKRYRVMNPLLEGSITYQVSLNAAKVYQSIKNGAVYLEDIAQDTGMSAGDISLYLKELFTLGAIGEDDDDLPDSFLGVKSRSLSDKKGYNFSTSSLPDLFAVNKDNLEKGRQEEKRLGRRKVNYLGSNLSAILSDDNIMAMATPYGGSLPQQTVAPQISQEEMAILMQQLMSSQQQQSQQRSQQQSMQQPITVQRQKLGGG